MPDLYIDSDTKTLTSSDSEKANVLADFFSSVFTEEDVAHRHSSGQTLLVNELL
jgi:hypothetical protein